MTLLKSILELDCIKHSVECISKKRALELISEIAGEKTGIDSRKIFENMYAREKLGSTGIGAGIAIPHSRVAQLESAIAVLLTLEKPIEFEAIDKQPVDILFALLVPEEKVNEHLKTLGAMAQQLNDKSLCRKLRHAQSDEELYRIILNLDDDNNEIN